MAAIPNQPDRTHLERTPIVDRNGRATTVWKHGLTPLERKRRALPPTPLLPQLAGVLDPLKEYAEEMLEVQRALGVEPSAATVGIGAVKAAKAALETMRGAREVNHPLNLDLSRHLFARLADVELHGSLDPRLWREKASQTAANFRAAFRGPEIYRGDVTPAQLAVLDDGADRLMQDSQEALRRGDRESAAVFAMVSDHIVDLALQDEPLKAAKRYENAYRTSKLPPDASDQMSDAFRTARERLADVRRGLNDARKQA